MCREAPQAERSEAGRASGGAPFAGERRLSAAPGSRSTPGPDCGMVRAVPSGGDRQKPMSSSGAPVDWGRVTAESPLVFGRGEDLDVSEDLAARALGAVGGLPLAVFQAAGDGDRPAE